ncbi:MAG: glycosyltransferase [Rhodospirillales bacterium]|jgi:glycosyltransferase involved in cell wall biosynthesis|nr:glycosyltransferase [Rhodospirillales bacterium]
MRVLQAMAGAEHGGAETFYERLVVGLHNAGVTQKVIIRKDQGRASRLRTGGVDPVELNFGGMLDFQTSRQLKKIVGEFNPDIVLTWMNRATKMMPAGAGYKLIARQGGYYDLKYYRHCDYIVGNTQGIVEYLKEEGWPENRVQYLPNFVSIEKAQPVSKAELSTPEGAPLLLSLGRLHRNKAFDVLIDALPSLEGVYVWIAGEGPERAALETQARAKGVEDRVCFLGWRQDVSALLASCDVYVCPSRHEPLGNVVIEGWAAGKPVVAAASQGPTELIRSGENGLLSPVDDSEALAQGISKVLADHELSELLVMAGRSEYETYFTEKAVVEKYLDFFNRILDQS